MSAARYACVDTIMYPSNPCWVRFHDQELFLDVVGVFLDVQFDAERDGSTRHAGQHAFIVVSLFVWDHDAEAPPLRLRPRG